MSTVIGSFHDKYDWLTSMK